MINERDRSQLELMSGIRRSERNTPEQNKRWKQNPTLIQAPRNTGRSESYGYAASPYSAASMGNRSGRPAGGNPTARATLLQDQRPKKKQKTTHQHQGDQFVSGRGTPMNVLQHDSRISAHMHSVIDVDTDDEDEDARIFSTSNRPNRHSHHSSSTSLGKRGSPSTKNRLGLEVDKGFDVGETSASKSLVYVPDGDETLALEKRYKDSSDPITEFTPPPAQGDHPRMGTVRGQVQKIEMANRLDLRDYDRKPVKNNMRGKKPSSSVLRDPEATASTKFVNSTAVNGSRLRPKEQGRLRVKEWFRGTEHRSGESACFVWWDERNLYMQENAKSKVWLAASTEILQVEYTENGEFIIFAIATVGGKKKSFNTRNSERFKLGDRHCGNVVFILDNGCDDWTPNNHIPLVNWIKAQGVDTRILRGSASQGRWLTAVAQSELADEEAKRREGGTQAVSAKKTHRPLKRPASTSENEVTPPPVDRLSQRLARVDPSTSSSRSVSHMADRDTSFPRSTSSPRRSARVQSSSRAQPFPTQDPDEVILCYPQGVTGAVNITNGDFKRLDPEEFLNDTLIEFGLKRWLRRLEENNPELAAQIHVFSSFFYKKLNKRNFEEGYESVRKWTAKFDIFSKKYIIVPINENLHWYLVIIYHPELILAPRPPAVKSPMTRARKSSPIMSNPLIKSAPTTLLMAEPSDSLNTLSFDAEHPSANSSPPALSPMQSPSEAEVEEVVMNGISSGVCSITIEPIDSPPASPTHSNPERIPSPDQQDNMTIPMDIDPFTHTFPSRSDASDRHQTTEFDEILTPSNDLSSGPVEPQTFYGNMSEIAIGKQKATPSDAILGQDDSFVHIEDDLAPSLLDPKNSTYIFTFDSLGSRHVRAIQLLAKYLKREAQDKLNKTDTGDAIGKQAQVPVQPNYCDCGLFLLHFAETFMSDPLKYAEIITTRTPRETKPTVQNDWKSELTADMRERLREDIHGLSLAWKETKRRSSGEGADGAETVDSSDDEIDIVETVPVVPADKFMKKGKTRKAMRYRG